MRYDVLAGIYDIYSPVYDKFGFLFKRRLARAIAGIPFQHAARVLDVGIGTGLSLEYYPAHVRVTGVDQSRGMLRQARQKVFQKRVRPNSAIADTCLLQADALSLPFANESFDVVFLSHVISTVSNPHHCLAEAMRVSTDHGYIVLLNHFVSRKPMMRFFEEAVDPICRRLGWRSAISLEELLQRFGMREDDLAAAQDDYISTIHLQKCKAGLRLLPVPAPIDEKIAIPAGA